MILGFFLYFRYGNSLIDRCKDFKGTQSLIEDAIIELNFVQFDQFLSDSVKGISTEWNLTEDVEMFESHLQSAKEGVADWSAKVNKKKKRDTKISS